jgi:hypothetical protein
MPMLPRTPRSRRIFCALALAVGAAVALAPEAAAQQARTQAPPDDTIRLFQRFVQDGAIAPHVWIEGQARLQTNQPVLTGDTGQRWSAGSVLGLGLTEDLEVGLSFGLVYLDPDNADSDSGLSDIEVHGKYRLDELPLSITVGGIIKFPTADDKNGIGTGKSDFEGFVAVRKDLGHVNVIGNAGLRVNGDPDVPGIDGETSLLLGGGAIIGLTPKLYNSWELTFESKRFSEGESDTRLTPGLMWRTGNRGLVRVGLGIGLSDGAPDFEAIGGIALTY